MSDKVDGEQKGKHEDNISIESKSKQDSGTDNKESGKSKNTSSKYVFININDDR